MTRPSKSDGALGPTYSRKRRFRNWEWSRALIEEGAERRVTRGALYATLERLERKGLLSWATEHATPERGGIPRWHFRVTREGVAALRISRQALANLSTGLDEALSRHGRPNAPCRPVRGLPSGPPGDSGSSAGEHPERIGRTERSELPPNSAPQSSRIHCRS